MTDKSQTYSVEGDKAELRHDLKRLARVTRCFSKTLKALWQAVKLLVCCFNRRQPATGATRITRLPFRIMFNRYCRHFRYVDILWMSLMRINGENPRGNYYGNANLLIYRRLKRLVACNIAIIRNDKFLFLNPAGSTA